eukprot:scaffold41746_cov67-Phaeocystis_antarctica.AAC.1
MILSSIPHVTASRTLNVLDILPMQLKLIICHPVVGSVTLAQGGGGGLGGGADGGANGGAGGGADGGNEGEGGGGDGEGGGGEGDGGGGLGDG